MSDTVIEVEHLSKRYRLGERLGGGHKYDTLRDGIANLFKRSRSKSIKRDTSGDMSFPEYIWALRDVSFQVKRGDILGIIGMNGAGKTTILKILSRITDPTDGTAIIKGRVGSLLEVGTGFHPELTGRENTYLSGAILGMKKREVERKFDEIVAFAELDKFMDTPVKFYSSGMYVRLAFAVAAHMEPEILLVDEVLAVGDIAFRKKCLGKMNVVTKEGRTVLFVSHNLSAINNLCPQAILLSDGRLKLAGSTAQVIAAYNRDCEQHTASFKGLEDSNLRRGDGRVRFIGVEVFGAAGSDIKTLGESLAIKLFYRANQDLPDVKFYIYISDEIGNKVLFCSNHFSGEVISVKKGSGVVQCLIRKNLLSPGKYWINADVYAGGLQCDYVERIQQFTVMYGDFYGTGMIPDSRSGRLVIEYEWKIPD